MKQRKFGNVLRFFCTVLPFCAILLAFTISSLKIAGKQELFSDLSKVATSVRELESSIKSDVSYKSELTEVYGLLHKGLNLNIIGDMEFMQDSVGVMQRIESATDKTAFIASVTELADKLQKTQTPLVFMALPDRGAMFDAADGFVYSGKTDADMLNKLSQAGVDVLDVYETMKTEGNSLRIEDFFFRTDIHLTTEAEFYLAQMLTEYLSDAYQIEFPATEQVYDVSQYQWQGYSFWGNLGRTAGMSFTGTDEFFTFVPMFETSLKLEGLSKSYIREGNFADVMSNGFSDPTGDQNLYWVTNYGRYPEAYYRYENKLYPDGPALLIICDSMSMRMNTFLTLNAGSVTVLDPRFFSGVEYVPQSLTGREYDAVIVCGSSSLFYTSPFKSTYEIPDTVRQPQNVGYYGMYLDYVNNAKPAKQGEIDYQLISGVDMVTLVGWAADFQAGAPLSALYLSIGESIFPCTYGIERPGMADYFSNPNLVKSGFEVSIPSAYLEDDIQELRFIQVGSDGSYRYEDVVFTISGEPAQLADKNDIPQTVRGKQDKGYYGMFLDTVNGMSPEKTGEVDRQLFEDGETITLIGWAADFQAGAPLSALYLSIGENVFPCTYGIERPGMADYFKNPNLIMSGFEVSVSSAYLQDGVQELRFIQIGSDGSYRYEDVVFTIKD